MTSGPSPADEGGEAPCFAHLLDEAGRLGAEGAGVEPVDLLSVVATGDGVAWKGSAEGLDANLVVLGAGGSIGEHRNDEVDVLVVVVDGELQVVVDGAASVLRAGSAAVVPRHTRRALAAGTVGARYLSIHRSRGALGIRSAAQGGGAGLHRG